MKIAILGDGGWGTTLAILLESRGVFVSLWSPFEGYARFLRQRRENVKFLKGVRIPRDIAISSDIKEALVGAQIVVLAVPSQFVVPVLKRVKAAGPPLRRWRAGLPEPRPIFVSVVKGIENKSLKRISELIHQILGTVSLVILSGPSIAAEVARGVPTTVVAASPSKALREKIQKIFSVHNLRVYTSADLIGVELGGALKNIIAIAAGISDGLGLGSNAKAALLARGLVEMKRLAVKMGGRERTLNGVSGIGDLITTCISKYGRNHWAGMQIAAGKTIRKIQKQTPMIAEGIPTAKSVYRLAKKYKVEMPISAEVYKILYQGKDPRLAVRDLMSRKLKEEY